MRKPAILIAAIFALPIAALALERNEVRGDIVSTSPQSDELTIRVTDSGDARSAQTGSTQTYSVPEDIEIEYTIGTRVYAPFGPGIVTLDDLEQGDAVLIRFEERNGTRTATNLRNERTSNVQARSRVERQGRDVTETTELTTDGDDMQMAAATDRNQSRRSRLPDSASVLPLLFLGGAATGAVGFAIGARRRRNS